MRFSLPPIRHDHSSFEALAYLYTQTEGYVLDAVEIDMNKTDWFDADMCAAFGAILYSLGDRLNKVDIIHIPQKVEIILSKNGFLSHYGRVKIPDQWGTTIPYQQFDDTISYSYQRFDDRDDDYFVRYIENEFIHRPEIPKCHRNYSRNSVRVLLRYLAMQYCIQRLNSEFLVVDSFSLQKTDFILQLRI